MLPFLVELLNIIYPVIFLFTFRQRSQKVRIYVIFEQITEIIFFIEADRLIEIPNVESVDEKMVLMRWLIWSW